MSKFLEKIKRAREAEVLRHRQILAWLEDPEDYRPNKVAKKPRASAPSVTPPVFSVVGAPPVRGADTVA